MLSLAAGYVLAVTGLVGYALVLTQVLGLTYADAAEVCGCPIGTIRSRVARARDDLLRAANEEDCAG